MQRKPIQLGEMSAPRSKRSAARAALALPSQIPSRDFPSSVLDEAFANYSRVDAGSSTIESSARSVSTDQRTTRELVADISMQLKALDSQRRQLARLLDTVS